LEFTKNNMVEGSQYGLLHQARHPSGIHRNTWAAMGWHVLRHRKRPDIVTHTGSTAGHRATIAFVKETKTGVVILSNSPFGHNGLEFSILRMLNDDWKRKAERD
jgi:CubicO group peptidase (beta-lactamase class C family)